MNLDRILHGTKAFAELEDGDISQFLKDRPFTGEHLNLEFKVSFPISKDRKYDLKKFCKYIVGFSNEGGGLVIYGVADDVNKSALSFPEYVVGLTQRPTLEDLSQWVTERVHPLVQSPAIRFFRVNEREVAVLKIPPGINRPYCYCDSASRAITFFKKTAGGIMELTPDQVRELYRDAIIEQSERILQVARMSVSGSPGDPANARIAKHKTFVIPTLESVADFGHLGIYCIPQNALDIPIKELQNFVTDHKRDFSEVMRFYPRVEPLQDGISIGYFPRAVRKDVQSTARITLYRDGLTAYDALADTLRDHVQAATDFLRWIAPQLRSLELLTARTSIS